MFKFFKWIYLECWIPANFYFSQFYGQIGQLRLAAEMIIAGGIIWLYFTGHILTHFQLYLAGAGVIAIGITGGYGLVKLGVPQKSNKMGNAVNPQFLEILDRLKKIEDKLG